MTLWKANITKPILHGLLKIVTYVFSQISTVCKLGLNIIFITLPEMFYFVRVYHFELYAFCSSSKLV